MKKNNHCLKYIVVILLVALLYPTPMVEAGRFRTCNDHPVHLEGDPNTRISSISFPSGTVPRQDLDNALDQWNNMLGMWLEFDPITTFGGTYAYDNGRNEIAFQNISSRGLTTTIMDACFWWFETQHIQEFDIEFNVNLAWTFGAPDENSNNPNRSFRYTAIHELGHALGLLHITDWMSVMKISNSGQSWYGGSAFTRVHPHPDDCYTTRYLYPYSNTHRDIGASGFQHVSSTGRSEETMANVTITVGRGDTFPVSASFGNLGNTYENFDIVYVLSTNDIISTFDRVVASGTGWGPSGSFHTFNWTATVPYDLSPDTYYLGLILDPNNNISEQIEGNNILLLQTMVRVVSDI